MDAETKAKIITRLDKLTRSRVESRNHLNAILQDFTERLFVALERAVDDLQAAGIKGLGKPRRITHPAGGDREALQLFIEDYNIIFVPMNGVARPNTEDEARIPPVQFKELCARIAVFLTNEPQATAFYDFILFSDRSWFAWGYGWPKQQDDIEQTDFDSLALELLDSFIRDIFVTWRTRSATTLSIALDPKKRDYTFGLPGDERHGT